MAIALTSGDHRWTHLTMARPLYAAQAALLDQTGLPLSGLGQDGELLSFLGGHIRRQDEEALTRRVIRRANWLQALSEDRSIVISDARPVDLNALKAAGFAIVEVSTPDALRRTRLRDRQDISANPDPTGVEMSERGISTDFRIENAGSLNDLAELSAGLVKQLPEPARALNGGTKETLDELGRALIQEAISAIELVYRPSRHQLACVMLGDDGELATGIHVEAEVGRASSCAENGALSQIVARGARPVAMVTVRHPRPEEVRGMDLVPPCGLCRELLGGYGPDAMVWLADGSSRLRELLPHKYRGTKWRNND
ncbi:cytidine/deoxycytidylate deaminase family protein [Arthrobacter woluwensis]|uniref:hypothetical protein n=1 Tax=Arthrobacter woluwensis TaxID=156980 RepID=UPI00381008E8